MTHLRPDSSVSASPQQSVAHLERSDTHSAQPSTQTAWNMTVFSPCRSVHTYKKWSQAFEDLQTGTRLLKESVTCWWEFPYTETSWWCRWGLCWWGGGGPARGEPRLCHVLPQSWHTQSRVTCHDTLIPETSPAPAKKKYRNYKTGGVGLKTAGTFSIFIFFIKSFSWVFSFCFLQNIAKLLTDVRRADIPRHRSSSYLRTHNVDLPLSSILLQKIEEYL